MLPKTPRAEAYLNLVVVDETVFYILGLPNFTRHLYADGSQGKHVEACACSTLVF
jgi:5-keto 4-deoxyuronate isomerase